MFFRKKKPVLSVSTRLKTEMTKVASILAQRGSSYGDYYGNAESQKVFANRLTQYLDCHPANSVFMQGAINHIAVKFARLLSFPKQKKVDIVVLIDTLVDLLGYATLTLREDKVRSAYIVPSLSSLSDFKSLLYAVLNSGCLDLVLVQHFAERYVALYIKDRETLNRVLEEVYVEISN